MLRSLRAVEKACKPTTLGWLVELASFVILGDGWASDLFITEWFSSKLTKANWISIKNLTIEE
jgi:hypothetical protein